METPFNMIVVGMTNSGKTHYLLRMLETDYMRHFEYVVLLCPTLSWNATYQSWPFLDNEDVILVECQQDQVDKVLHIVSEVYKGTNTCIILDDCASSQDLKNRVSELVKLAFSARHYGLSLIVLTQQLTSISIPYRENVSKIVTFYNTNRHDMKTITDDYLNCVEKEEIDDINRKLRDNKYARIEIQLRHPYDYEVVIPRT